MNKFAEKYSSFMAAVAWIAIFWYGIYLYFHQNTIEQFIKSSRFLTQVFETIWVYWIIWIFIVVWALVAGFSIYYIFND